MDAFTSLYVWQMMYLQMRLYDENFGEKFSSYRRIFAQISIWEYIQNRMESHIYTQLQISYISSKKKKELFENLVNFWTFI